MGPIEGLDAQAYDEDLHFTGMAMLVALGRTEPPLPLPSQIGEYREGRVLVLQHLNLVQVEDLAQRHCALTC